MKKAQENLKSVEQSEYEKLMNSVDMTPKYEPTDAPTTDLLAHGVSKLYSIPKKYSQK
jgi:hypothetical protein